MKVFFKFLTTVITVLSLSSASYAQVSDSQLLEMYENALNSEQAVFNDLGQVPWAVLPVTRLAERGIVSGMGGGIFAPKTSITRAQLAQILYKADLNVQVTYSSIGQ